METYNKELCGERHERIDSTLEKHGEQIDSLEKCTIKLTQMIENHDMMCKDNYKRITKIENKPSDIVGKIMGYALGALFGALASYLGQSFV